MRRLVLAALAATALSAGALAQTAATGSDPFRWLEEIEAPRSLDWVKAQNAVTARRLEDDDRYAAFHDQALAIFTAKDRIPEPGFLGEKIENFWQDADHPRGVWRRTAPAGYATAEPPWETLLDLDALAKTEGRDWIWKGDDCLPPADRYCLVRLSNGGKDAVELREFDTVEKRFVEGGFRLGEGKQTVEWLDHDTLIAARDFSGTGADLSRAGYPLAVRYIRRGETAPGPEIFRGQPTDNQVGPRVLRGKGGAPVAVVIGRGRSFFESESYLLTDKGPVKLPLPKKAQVDGVVDGQMVFTVREPFAGFGAGSLLSYDLAALKADPATVKPMLVLQPGPTQAIQGVRRTANRLVVSMLDNVQGQAEVYRHGAAGWTHARLPLPKGEALTLRAASEADDRIFVTSEGFLTPPTLWLADASAGTVAKARSLPARFDASKDVVEQLSATSTDGARIPYFVVRPRALKYDGQAAVQMFGYGGFEIAETPIYRPEMGKLWLERGGVYVVANIRGGGEFGPAWHEAALREHRQLAFDDFATVTKDLMARKITSPRRMGIYGRSNGGVLTTVSMTQHPELFNAVVVESPLVDMLRYNHLSAGASWVAEYGDPDVAADRDFIARYSGYQALKPGVRYPEAYVTTNTKDDRVHPGHARKFAARLESLNDPVLYYENTFGGHANDADPELNARRWARHYVYLSQKLMD